MTELQHEIESHLRWDSRDLGWFEDKFWTVIYKIAKKFNWF